MVAQGNVGLAFGLVCIAGATSMIGAVPILWAHQARPKILAAALGFAAGLMIFVSLAEILVEGSIRSFILAGNSEEASIRYGILLFWGGCLIVFAIDKTINLAKSYASLKFLAASRSWQTLSRRLKGTRDVSNSKKICEETQDATKGVEEAGETSASVVGVIMPSLDQDIELAESQMNGMQKLTTEVGNDAMLKRMSMLVALSLALHNFPEGIAVFISALRDGKFGAAVAIAIAVHNIPEGFCISLPVYYATGSRWKAFWWTLIPSAAEPLGGLLAYVAFTTPNDIAFGIAFGLVSGIMVYVAVMELLPAAFKYDSKNVVVTAGAILGMLFMGFSLILLTL